MDVRDIRDKLVSKGEYPKRDVSKITHIDIHHSASFSNNFKGIETIKDFADYHVNGHKWPGIGYHYIVAPNGIIYKTGYANEMRWSVGGNNSYTISVMLIGRFNEEEIGNEQYEEALKLVRQMMSAYNIPKENVMGHNEYPDQNTLCPGIDMDKFRSDL
ncbi:MAG: N-acetylmuramoyl-L-alanine amidase fused to LysM and peptidoglycan binding domain [Candidatus Frackibacter sp. T328-2]|nr:MAG: N-acetylmuramoyl-L-alanine amidase fused to LysM and peptidoglycan binding domain [Candidatus Frackibacter sp. T328-2]